MQTLSNAEIAAVSGGVESQTVEVTGKKMTDKEKFDYDIAHPFDICGW